MLMQQVKTPAAACTGGVDGLVLTGRPASEEKKLAQNKKPAAVN